MTPEEKRKILQERRQAKMKGGNATERLNNILNLGSSVKSSVSSVLDRELNPTKTSTSNNNIDSASVKSQTTFIKSHPDDDPDTLDIEQLVGHRAQPQAFQLTNTLDESVPDPNAFFNSLFGETSGKLGDQDPISAMMTNMMNLQQRYEGENPESLKDMEYESKLLNYKRYRQKQLKFKFLIMRYLLITLNFVYHYINFAQFRSSSYSYIRQEFSSNSYQFIYIFLSLEAVILSSYYLISSNRKVTENIGTDSFILKVVSMASMVIPTLSQYQGLIAILLSYWEIFNIFIGDLALLVVLFGITSGWKTTNLNQYILST